MGKSFLADIPANSFQKVYTVESVASNADSVIGSAALVAQANLKLKRAWYIPWVDQGTIGTATTSATYRRIQICNGGTAGTATTIMASANIVASIASRGSKAFTTTSNNTASGGEMIYFSALTVGGNDDDGSTLQSGLIQVEYELL